MESDAKLSILESRLEKAEKDVAGYETRLQAQAREVERLKSSKGVYGVLALASFVVLAFSYFMTETRVQGVQAATEKELHFHEQRLDDIKARKINENKIQDAHLVAHTHEFGHRGISEDVKQLQTELAILASNFDEHSKEGFHAEAAIKSKELDERVKVIEADIKDDEGTFTQLSTDLTKLTGLTERAHLLIETNIEKAAEMHKDIATNANRLGAVSASTESGFVEVETQLRSILEVMNVRWQGMKTIQSLIYRKAFNGEDLPEEDYYPDNIPAAATSATGRINGK